MDTIAGYALVVGVAFIGATLVTGPLQSAMENILDDVNSFQSQGTDLEVEDHYDLAGGAKLTMDRALECDRVARKYPDLRGTKIGQKPKCSRSPLPAPPATDNLPEVPEGDLSGAVEGTGDDVEGIDGRLTFNITKSGGIVLRSIDVQTQTEQDIGAPLNGGGYGTERGGAYFEIDGVSKKPYEDTVVSSCETRAGYETPSSDSSTDYPAASNKFSYIVTFKNAPDDVTDRFEFGKSSGDLTELSDPGPYCGGVVDNQLDDKLSRVKLCQGDQGYIQVNKGEPTNNARREDPQGKKTFGYIQITDPVEECDLDRDIEPFKDQDRHGGSTADDTLRVQMNVQDYPGLAGDSESQDQNDPKSFDLLDSSESPNVNPIPITTTTPDKVTVNNQDPKGEVPPNQCAISLVEKSNFFGGGDKEGWIRFNPGTHITNKFPRTGEATAASMDFSGSNSATASEQTNIEKLYSKLSNVGFTRELIDDSHGTGDLLLTTGQGNRFEMYGPLACGSVADDSDDETEEGQSESLWHLCLTKGPNSAGTRGKEIDTNADSEPDLECTASGWEQ